MHIVSIISAIALAFKAWMTIDAVMRCRGNTCGNYWYIITLMPFGDVAYFVMVKRHDPEIVNFFKIFTYRTPKLDNYEHLYATCPSQHNRIQLAKLAIDCQQYERATQVLQEALKVDSSDKETHFLLGLAYLRNTQRSKAIEIFSELIKKDFSYREGETVHLLIETYAEEKQWENALTLARTLAKRIDRMDSRVLLARVLISIDKIAEAREVLNAALKDYQMSPRYVKAHYRLAAKQARGLLQKVIS